MLVTKKSLLLFAGSRFLGSLQPDEFDWPITFAAFEAAEAFEEFRELFEKQNAPGGFKEVNEQMDALDLRIVDPDVYEERLFTILIDGARAKWRVGFTRAANTAINDEFWRTLGDEIGPETCREPGCYRLKISLSVFCRRHHFRMMMKEDYDG